MSLNSLHVPPKTNLLPRIVVLGVGGAGCNAINNMRDKGLEGAEFLAANTDAQSLDGSTAGVKIQLGADLTQGLGAGSNPEIGFQASEESKDELIDHLSGVHMVFITAGMGGGTGTGAGPNIAKLARELGILTVAVVTKPFTFEGQRRMDVALDGVKALRESAHTIMVVPNENLFMMANENTTTTDAFVKADDVLYQAVKGVTDLIIRPGLINLDFADVKSIMLETGSAMMGCGEAEGPDRGSKAAELAIHNPLLEETCLSEARGILINVVGGSDLSLWDLNSASTKIREEVNKDARVIVGSSLEKDLEGTVRVSLVATGLNPVSAEQAGALESSFDKSRSENSFFSQMSARGADDSWAKKDADKWSEFPRMPDLGFGQGEPQRSFVAQRDEEPVSARRSIFVAPKPSANDDASGLSSASDHIEPTLTASRDSLQDKPKRSGLGGVFDRMTKPYDGVRDPDRDEDQVRLTSESSPRIKSDGVEQDDNIRTPAFMRRQAN